MHINTGLLKKSCIELITWSVFPSCVFKLYPANAYILCAASWKCFLKLSKQLYIFRTAKMMKPRMKKCLSCVGTSAGL